MDFKDSKILAIFAHPDDESYIVGGTLALAAAQGAEIHLISATRGDKGVQHVADPQERERITHIREQELRNACKILGIREVEVWDFPDGNLDNLGAREHELNNKLINSINLINPNLILTFGPNGVSRHRDHIAIGALATKAARTCADQRGKNTLTNAEIEVYGVTIPRELIAGFERILSTRKKTTSHYHEAPLHDSPSLNDVERVDISSVIETKYSACRMHASQNPAGLIASFEKLPAELKNFESFLPLTLP